MNPSGDGDFAGKWSVKRERKSKDTAERECWKREKENVVARADIYSQRERERPQTFFPVRNETGNSQLTGHEEKLISDLMVWRGENDNVWYKSWFW